MIDSHNDSIVGLVHCNGGASRDPKPARAEPRNLFTDLRGSSGTAEIEIQSDIPAMFLRSSPSKRSANSEPGAPQGVRFQDCRPALPNFANPASVTS